MKVIIRNKLYLVDKIHFQDKTGKGKNLNLTSTALGILMVFSLLLNTACESKTLQTELKQPIQPPINSKSSNQVEQPIQPPILEPFDRTVFLNKYPEPTLTPIPEDPNLAEVLPTMYDMFKQIHRRKNEKEDLNFSELLELAINENDPDAQFSVGIHYLNCKIDNYCKDHFADNNMARDRTALEWMKKAADQGHSGAQVQYLRYAQMGLGLTRTYVDEVSQRIIRETYGEEMIASLFNSAKGGNIGAQVNVVQFYHRGELIYGDTIRKVIHGGEPYNAKQKALEWALIAVANLDLSNDMYAPFHWLEAHYYAGVLYEEMGDYENALLFYARTIQAAKEMKFSFEHAPYSFNNLKNRLLSLALLDKLAREGHVKAQVVLEGIPHKDLYNNLTFARELLFNEGDYSQEKVALLALDAASSENPNDAFINLLDQYKQEKNMKAVKVVEYVNFAYLELVYLVLLDELANEGYVEAQLILENKPALPNKAKVREHFLNRDYKEEKEVILLALQAINREDSNDIFVSLIESYRQEKETNAMRMTKYVQAAYEKILEEREEQLQKVKIDPPKVHLQL